MAKSFSIASPEVLPFEDETTKGEMSHKMFHEESVGVNIPVHHTVFALGVPEENFRHDFDIEKALNPEIVAHIHNIAKTVQQCVPIAERLFERLKHINYRFKTFEDLKDIFDEVAERYEKMDFMGHRNVFSKILKSKRINWLNEILNDYSIEGITKPFYTLIMDRNKYTHGQVMYWAARRLAIIKYINSESKKEEYAILDKDVINSFIDCAKGLDELFDKITDKLS